MYDLGCMLVMNRDFNTQGVCHQLSNGFELKHDMLSGDEDVKIKSTKSELQLKLQQHTFAGILVLFRYIPK